MHTTIMELSRIILLILRDEKRKVPLAILLRHIVTDGHFESLLHKPSTTEITHTLDLLVEDGYVIKSPGSTGGEFQIGTKGYERLKAWYTPTKFMNLISTDVSKMLSIIATILGIVATYLSIAHRH